MKTHQAFLAMLSLLVTAALTGCDGNQPLAPETAALNGNSAVSLMKSVPFTSSVSGTLELTSGTTAELTATGKASHLGNISYGGSVLITSQTDTRIIDDLTETMTAANGDQLVILCHQEANLVGDGVFESTNDSWTVIGGTGRFSGATGSGTGTTRVDFNTNTFTKTCTGTISY